MIRHGNEGDLAFLLTHDRHIAPEEIKAALARGRYLLLELDGRIVGWLRWNLFWDNTPFLNMLYLLEDFRGQGHGRALMEVWEDEMRRAGYEAVLTSTLSDETAQQFYRKLGYVDAGALLLPREALEILFRKQL